MTDVTDSSDPRDAALEQAITGALGARAGTVDVPADAWAQLDARRATGARTARGTWIRSAIPTLAVAAATVLLVGVGAALRGPAPAETTVTATIPPTTVTEPVTEPVPDAVTVPGPTPTTTPPPSSPPTSTTIPTTGARPPATWADIDLGSLTLPTAACVEAYRMPGETFTLTGGHAGALPSRDETATSANVGPGVELLAPAVFGDLDGDGRDEAVIQILCGLAYSDGLSNSVVVLRLVDGRPAVAALLLDSGTGASIDRPVVDDDRSPVRYESGPAGYDSAQDVAVEGGLLRVTWRQFDLGFAGITATVRYRIADGRAAIVGTPVRVPVPFPDFLAIRHTDVRAMTLPLASRRICASFLDPLGPLADAHLVGGTAGLTAPDGHPVDGSITITDVRYGEVAWNPAVDADGSPIEPQQEDAVVLVSCRRGGDTFVTPAVATLRDGRPVLLVDLGPIVGMQGVSAIDAKPQTLDVVVTWANGAVTAYGWTGSGYVPTAIPAS